MVGVLQDMARFDLQEHSKLNVWRFTKVSHAARLHIYLVDCCISFLKFCHNNSSTM